MKYIVGNWKMNLGIRESVALARGVLRFLRGKEKTPEVILCPSYPALAEVHKVLARSRVQLGAQNVAGFPSGPHTGEVSAAMLEDAGCSWTIIGHSERRATGETDDMIHEKVAIASNSKLTPILCVGESLGEREAGKAMETVARQLGLALSGHESRSHHMMLVAYEPVWAIGTGKTPTVGDIVEMHAFIRETVKRLTGIREERLMVLYGGSVDGENAYAFLREREVDGVLVGGASIKPHQFEEVLSAAVDVIEAQG